MYFKAEWKEKLECAACRAGYVCKIGVCGIMALAVALAMVYTLFCLYAALIGG